MGVSTIVFDEENAPYFKNLPEWLQRDILAENNKRLLHLAEKKVVRQEVLEKICAGRGYELNPTRGEMSWPYTRRRSRRPVGDYSLGEYD